MGDKINDDQLLDLVKKLQRRLEPAENEPEKKQNSCNSNAQKKEFTKTNLKESDK